MFPALLLGLLLIVSAGLAAPLAHAAAPGTVWVWGSNFSGQLGDGTTTQQKTPIELSGLTNVVEIAAGAEHSLALKSDGTVWSWGVNTDGQVGDGTNINRDTPVQVSSITGVADVVAGQYHSLALKSDGTVWGWGRNAQGQLGDGTTTNSNAPVQVSVLTGTTAISRVPGNGVRGRGSGEKETTASSLARIHRRRASG